MSKVLSDEDGDTIWNEPDDLPIDIPEADHDASEKPKPQEQAHNKQVDDPGEFSDGYHTFNELYAHRIALFIALAVSHGDIAWRSLMHDDGSQLDGWFIAGMHLPTGDISYHLPDAEWDRMTGYCTTLPKSPKWDGHTSDDVVKRLNEWIENYE